MLHPRPRFDPGTIPRRGNALQHFDHSGPDHRTEIKYSHATRNSSFGESCSIARANKNSSSSFHSVAPIDRQPGYRATSRR
jgi:hypothetical protein